MNELKSLDLQELAQPKQQDVIISMWKLYNLTSNTLSQLLGRTNNIVGEYAELLIAKFLNGEFLPASNRSADLRDSNGRTYQVKSRKVTSVNTQLSVIRSWDFDFLMVVLFNFKGEIIKAVKLGAENAKNSSVYNVHQNGWVITTNNAFFNQQGIEDITSAIAKLNLDEEQNINPSKKRKKQTANSTEISNYKEFETSNPKFSKHGALQILLPKHRDINQQNSTFSSPNKATGNWWLEPEINKFKNDLFIILYDDKNLKLHLFRIPANSIKVPEKQLYFRENKNAVSINIPFTENGNFLDSHTEFSFNRYLVESVAIQ